MRLQVFLKTKGQVVLFRKIDGLGRDPLRLVRRIWSPQLQHRSPWASVDGSPDDDSYNKLFQKIETSECLKNEGVCL